MLKKLYRLTKKNDFDSVFKRGRASYGNNMGVKAADNNLSYSRFGIVVSAKVSKKAVDRNRVKRLIREAIRLNLAKLAVGKDCVIIAQPLLLGKEFKEVETELKKHLNKLRLLSK